VIAKITGPNPFSLRTPNCRKEWNPCVESWKLLLIHKNAGKWQLTLLWKEQGCERILWGVNYSSIHF
jgi:hypothetical protein